MNKNNNKQNEFICKKINTMLQLNETQIKELEAFLLEIPAKFANPIFQFLGKIAQEQGVKNEEPQTEA